MTLFLPSFFSPSTCVLNARIESISTPCPGHPVYLLMYRDTKTYLTKFLVAVMRMCQRQCLRANGQCVAVVE